MECRSAFKAYVFDGSFCLPSWQWMKKRGIPCGSNVGYMYMHLATWVVYAQDNRWSKRAK